MHIGDIGETCILLALRLLELRHTFKEGLIGKSKLGQDPYDEGNGVRCNEARLFRI
jgi:hypothetical protein